MTPAGFGPPPAAGRARVAALLAAAAVLVLSSLWLPLWQMTLQAPQYPDGLAVVAYGDRVEGDVAEINIVNHYIGMAAIEAEAVPEMRLFAPSVKLLAAACLLALFARPLLRLVALVASALPLVILGDLQWWLHRFGHHRDPAAPLRFVEPFTPPVVGISTIGNFRSINLVSFGFLALVAAAALLWLALRSWPPRRRTAAAAVAPAALPRAAAVALVGALVLAGAVAAAAGGGVEARAEEAAVPAATEAEDGFRPMAELQARIDAAPPGARVVVHGGRWRGTLRLTGPRTVEGVGWPLLDGGGAGTVVVVEGDGVTLRGFRVENGGRGVSAEPAGIAVTGSRHRIEGNLIADVYFGVHLAGGAGNVVRGNRIAPGGRRPGHAISLWNQQRARVEGNRIERARDGIYLSFADDVEAVGNTVTGSRYGVHSMYSQRSRFTRNRIAGNLVGASLMYSEGLVLACNRIEDHREGATAYGVLLKDVADVRVEGNLLAGNRVAIYADNTPLAARGEALVAGNRIVGNDAALALQSTARLTLTGNALLANLAPVRLEGRGLAAGTAWARGGRGNHWDDYRGYDRGGDGIGDLPHVAVLALPGLLAGDHPARALVWTPAHQLVEASARLFPVLRPRPVVDDPAPLVLPPPAPACLGGGEEGRG